MISDPPLDAGAAHVTSACVLPPVAVTLVGAPRTAAGLTILDGVDLSLSPTLFVATTMNVYEVPLSSSLNVAVSFVPPTVSV